MGGATGRVEGVRMWAWPSACGRSSEVGGGSGTELRGGRGRDRVGGVQLEGGAGWAEPQGRWRRPSGFCTWVSGGPGGARGVGAAGGAR